MSPDPVTMLREARAGAPTGLDLPDVQRRARRYLRRRARIRAAALSLPVVLAVAGFLLQRPAPAPLEFAAPPVTEASRPAPSSSATPLPTPTPAAPSPPAERPPSPAPTASTAEPVAPAPSLAPTVPAPPPPAPPQVAAPAPPGPWWLDLEAESGELAAPMAAFDDPGASRGHFVQVEAAAGNDDEAGAVTLAFEVPQAGDHVVWARVRARSSGSNSLRVSVDGGQDQVWHLDGEGRGDDEPWIWMRFALLDADGPRVYDLTAGLHRLRLGNREDGTQVDRVVVTADLSDAPPPDG